jgi:hypothetical protein
MLIILPVDITLFMEILTMLKEALTLALLAKYFLSNTQVAL